MDKNPIADRIFHLAADLDPKARIAVAISLACTEASRIGKTHPDLKTYMDQECGVGWENRPNSGVQASMAFMRYLHEDRFNKPRVTVEA